MWGRGRRQRPERSIREPSDAKGPQMPGAGEAREDPPSEPPRSGGEGGEMEGGRGGGRGEEHSWWGQDLVRSAQLQSPPGWNRRTKISESECLGSCGVTRAVRERMPSVDQRARILTASAGRRRLDEATAGAARKQTADAGRLRHRSWLGFGVSTP